MSRAGAEEQLRLVKPDYTPRQGRFLAFIRQYHLLHQRAPSEADFREFFRITPPSVHSMILTLERRGFIKRVPGQPRSITLLLPPEFLPSLEAQDIQSVPKEGKNGLKSSSWSVLRKQLDSWEKRELLDLLQDLYGLSRENRDFIAAHLKAGADAGEALEKYRVRIVNQFFPEKGDGKLHLGEARKAIRDYRKATGNLEGTAELLLTYVENGARFTHEFGDINETFYDSLESALDELAGLLRDKAPGLYPLFRGRLAEVDRLAHRVGWGFGDHVADQISVLETECGGRKGKGGGL